MCVDMCMDMCVDIYAEPASGKATSCDGPAPSACVRVRARVRAREPSAPYNDCLGTPGTYAEHHTKPMHAGKALLYSIVF